MFADLIFMYIFVYRFKKHMDKNIIENTPIRIDFATELTKKALKKVILGMNIGENKFFNMNIMQFLSKYDGVIPKHLDVIRINFEITMIRKNEKSPDSIAEEIKKRLELCTFFDELVFDNIQVGYLRTIVSRFNRENNRFFIVNSDPLNMKRAYVFENLWRRKSIDFDEVSRAPEVLRELADKIQNRFGFDENDELI